MVVTMQLLISLRKLRKSTWFSVAPTVLSISGQVIQVLVQAWGHKISRAGDYLLRTWLRVSITIC
jgi:hypothetical protein